MNKNLNVRFPISERHKGWIPERHTIFSLFETICDIMDTPNNLNKNWNFQLSIPRNQISEMSEIGNWEIRNHKSDNRVLFIKKHSISSFPISALQDKSKKSEIGNNWLLNNMTNNFKIKLLQEITYERKQPINVQTCKSKLLWE